jgi:hypothetical protein
MKYFKIASYRNKTFRLTFRTFSLILFLAWRTYFINLYLNVNFSTICAIESASHKMSSYHANNSFVNNVGCQNWKIFS